MTTKPIDPKWLDPATSAQRYAWLALVCLVVSFGGLTAMLIFPGTLTFAIAGGIMSGSCVPFTFNMFQFAKRLRLQNPQATRGEGTDA